MAIGSSLAALARSRGAGTCAGRYPRRAGITRRAQGTSGPWVHLGLVQRRYAVLGDAFFCLGLPGSGFWGSESPLSTRPKCDVYEYMYLYCKKTEHSTSTVHVRVYFGHLQGASPRAKTVLGLC